MWIIKIFYFQFKNIYNIVKVSWLGKFLLTSLDFFKLWMWNLFHHWPWNFFQLSLWNLLTLNCGAFFNLFWRWVEILWPLTVDIFWTILSLQCETFLILEYGIFFNFFNLDWATFLEVFVRIKYFCNFVINFVILYYCYFVRIN